MMDIQKLIKDAERADCVASLMDGVNPHHVLELASRLAEAEAHLAVLAKQEPSGWYAVENAIRDLGEPLYLDGRHKPSGWNSDYKPLYARAAPPAPFVVKNFPARKSPSDYVDESFSNRDLAAIWNACRLACKVKIQDAGGSVAE